jgi:hypothetical protein
MQEDRWQETLEALQLTEVLDEELDVSAAFTNEFLPAA